MSDFAVARHNMLDSQLRPNGIYDEALLVAMATLPRERFLPERLRGIAYVDEDVALGGGHFLMEPLVLARLLQLAEVGKTDKALDVGCGTGYATAVLANLCHNVIGLECDHAIARETEKRLRDLGIRNAWMIEGRLEAGYAPRARYDVILLGGAVEAIPSAVTDQLEEGGRLVAVMRAPGAIGRTTVVTRTKGVFASRSVHDAATLALPGFARPKEFVF